VKINNFSIYKTIYNSDILILRISSKLVYKTKKDVLYNIKLEFHFKKSKF